MRHPGHTHTASFTRGFPFGMVLAAGFLPLLTAAQSTADNPPERNYVVYVGLDVAVQSGMEKATVVDSGEKSLTVARAGRREQVSLHDAQFKLSMEPKLSRHQLRIEQVRGDAVFDPRTDPARNSLHQQMVMDSVQSHRQMVADIQASRAQATAASTERAAAQPNSTVSQADVEQAQLAAEQASTAADAAYAVPLYNPGARGIIGAGENDGFDSYEVTFRLSAPENHKELLGVLRLLVRDPSTSAAPGAVLKFFSVRNVGPAPRKVTVLQSGLPRGFVVDSYTIHLYADGQEFPTNLSRNRVEVTAAEAHQFVVLRHVHANQTASLPMSIIHELVPEDMRRRLDSFGPEMTVEIAVDRDGRPTAVSSPHSQGDPQHEILATALRDIPFLPALLEGKPVDSKGTFAIYEFIR